MKKRNEKQPVAKMSIRATEDMLDQVTVKAQSLLDCLGFYVEAIEPINPRKQHFEKIGSTIRR